MEKLEFCSFKCKLKTLVRDKGTLKKFSDYTLLAHKTFKRTSAFFRLYCLSLSPDDYPEISESTTKQCINKVSIRDCRGCQLRDSELSQKFWEEHFSKIYGDKLDMRGRAGWKWQLQKECSMQFWWIAKPSRFFQLVLHLLGGSRECCKEAGRVTEMTFREEWKDMNAQLVETLRKCPPWIYREE